MFIIIIIAATLAVVPIHAMGTVIPGAFMVEYADSGTPNSIIQQHTRLLTSLGPLSNLLQIRQTYSSVLFRGVSINLDSPSQSTLSRPIKKAVANNNNMAQHPVLERLFRHPEVLNIFPIMEVPRPQWIEDQQVHLPYENKLSQLKDIHEKLGISGSGIKVGILDSGVDYNHPALGGGFGKGYKIQLGYNLIDPSKDDQEAGNHRGPNDPYDVCTDNSGGHGTHVSGIIAGIDKSKNFIGVAPNVTLGMWRIFGCTGGAGEDTVIKALEMAYNAGCNVINLSLGTQDGWKENSMSIVANRLVENGVVVVSVAGNQGSEGVFMQNSPGSGPKVISVASVDNSFYLTQIATISAFPNETYPYELSTSTEKMPNGTLAVLFEEQKPDRVISACPGDVISATAPLDGSILLVRRGGCTFADKLSVAEKVGAKAVLFYDPDAKDVYHAVQALTPDDSVVPAAGISKQFADRLVAIAKKYEESTKNATFDISFSSSQYTQTLPSAGRVSSFSSVGPTYELDLKPTLAGIGNQVYSTVPRHIGDGWGTRSGTSMASPHIAGVAALMLSYYKQKNITVDPLFITEQLQNHAQQAMFDGQPDHPLLQGAGLVQPFSSLLSEVHISPGYISFNDTGNSVKTYQLRITNNGKKTISGKLRHTSSKAILPYDNTTTRVFAEPNHRDDTKVELDWQPKSIILQQGQSIDVQVTVKLPSIGHNYQMYGGYIQFVSKDGTKSDNPGDGDNVAILGNVPYFGVIGLLNDLPLFDRGFPYLASGGDPKIIYNSTDTYILNTTEAQFPNIICRLLTPTSQVKIQVLDQSNNIMGDIDGGPFKYWERNRLSAENYYRKIQWNGKIATNANLEEIVMIPQGTYRLQVKALKMFGDPNIQEQWEQWISGPMLVQ